MMVRVSRPDDALEDFAEVGGGAQVAIGVESNGVLCVWAKAKGAGSASWLQVGSAYADNDWLRISLNFDYSAGRCQLLVNGQSVVSSHGYITANAAAADTRSGSWFTLAGAPAAGKSISAVCITGSAGLDDFVAQSGVQAAGEEAFPVADNVVVSNGTSTIEVKVSYLNKYGLAWDSTTNSAPDNSGMTVEQKYVAGLDPTDGSKFEMKDMGFEKVGGTEYVTFTIPGQLADTSKYTYKVEEASSPSGFATATEHQVDAEGGKVKIAIPDSGVKYYKVSVGAK